jgi:predicted Zn-dependent protease
MRLALFPLACLTLLAQSPGLTPAREAAIGRQVAENIRRSTTPVESQAVQDYVGRLGARLVAELPDSASSYTFSVVSTDSSNTLHEPLAIPGGYVFVPTSLLLAANDEAEFAGMLARAIVQPTYLTQAHTGASPTIPVFTLIDSFSPMSTMAQSRQIQLEADKSAVPMMSRAGFDPAALLRYIERVQPSDAARDARIVALREAISEVPPASYVDSGQFRSIQDRVRSLTVPPTRTHPAPSLFR